MMEVGSVFLSEHNSRPIPLEPPWCHTKAMAPFLRVIVYQCIGLW